MATVTNPLMSLTASGTHAHAITFRQTRRHAIAAKYGKPSGKASTAQAAHRAAFAALAAAWTTASTEDKASWDAMATANSYTRYDAYIKENFRRLKASLPTITNATTTDTVPTTLYVHNQDIPADPDCTGPYTRINDFNGYPCYEQAGTTPHFISVDNNNNAYFISDAIDPENSTRNWTNGLATPTGPYYPVDIDTTGNPTVTTTP